jgi:hypothetical protein
MADNAYDPNVKYNDTEQFNITGSVINGISRTILALQQQVKDLEEAEEKQELKALRIRDRNPSVKDAWDQYQIVLGLAKE